MALENADTGGQPAPRHGDAADRESPQASAVTPPPESPLTAAELERYSWQFAASDLGLEPQRRLRNASVLVSRIGGVGGTAALYLAAAGIGRLVLAHAGPIRRADLNRQILMSTARVGRPRVEAAAERLAALNPHVVVETVNENLSVTNARRFLAGCHAAVGAAPLFAERFALNAAAVRAGIPVVDAAMYDTEIRLFTTVADRACLACLYPGHPPHWRRRFPVLGAVAGVAGALAASEVVRLLAGTLPATAGQLAVLDVATLTCRRFEIPRRAGCTACGGRETAPAAAPVAN